MATPTQEQTRTEQFKVEGDQLLAETKRLIKEGNVRRISIKQGEHTVLELPLTIGLAGVLTRSLARSRRRGCSAGNR